MTESYGSWVKVSKIYVGKGSLTFLYKGPWKEISENLVSAIKSMGFGCVYIDFDWYRYTKDFTLRDGSFWTIDFSLIRGKDDFVDGTVEALVKMMIYKIKPVGLDFFVAFHPRELKVESSADAVDLIRLALIRILRMVEDVDRMGGWIHLMNDNWVLIFHDGKDIRRVEFILGHSKLPYSFVVSYHVDGSLVCADYRMVAKDKPYFDTLVEAIIDEYLVDVTRGGDQG